MFQSLYSHSHKWVDSTSGEGYSPTINYPSSNQSVYQVHSGNTGDTTSTPLSVNQLATILN